MLCNLAMFIESHASLRVCLLGSSERLSEKYITKGMGGQIGLYLRGKDKRDLGTSICFDSIT